MKTDNAITDSFGLEASQSSGHPGDWTTTLPVEDLSIEYLHELLNKWNFIMNHHSNLLKRISDNLSTMGMNNRDEGADTTPQFDLTELTGRENELAFDFDAFDFNFNAASTLDTTEIDTQETLGMLFIEEETDYTSLIDHSNLPGPVILADNHQSLSLVGGDFFDL